MLSINPVIATQEENVMKGHDNQKLTPTLADAAKTFISCAENIRETTESIICSCVDRLSENTKSEKFGIATKGLMTRKSAKMPILGQPVDITSTKRVDYESIPHIKTNELKELATLYNLAAKRLNSAARKLLEGDLRDDTLTEIIVYGLFLIEEMKSEEYRVNQVLNMLRESYQDSHNLMLN